MLTGKNLDIVFVLIVYYLLLVKLRLILFDINKKYIFFVFLVYIFLLIFFCILLNRFLDLNI